MKTFARSVLALVLAVLACLALSQTASAWTQWNTGVGEWSDNSNWTAGSPGPTHPSPGYSDQGIFIPTTGTALLSATTSDAYVVDYTPGNYFALEGGLQLLNGATLMVSGLHIQNGGSLLLQDASKLVVTDLINVGEWGSGSLSLLGGSTLGAGTLFNQENVGTLTLDLTGWVNAASIITADAFSLDGTVNLTGLGSMAAGDKITLISSQSTVNSDGKRWVQVEVDGALQSLTDLGGGLYGFDYNGGQYVLNYGDGTGAHDVTISLVPEPAVMTMVPLGLLALVATALYRRRAAK